MIINVYRNIERLREYTNFAYSTETYHPFKGIKYTGGLEYMKNHPIAIFRNDPEEFIKAETVAIIHLKFKD